MDIQVEKLSFRYGSVNGSTPVLDDVSFCLDSGECLALIGPSGSGKSTLAQHLNGLLRPDSGRILVGGQLLGWSAAELHALRRRVGLVFQFPEAQIFEGNVFDEVAFAARQWGFSGEEIPQLVKTALEIVGLKGEDLYHRNPLRLSGGEARLVSIASLLVVDPDWLILDEPTLGLDFAHWRCIQELICRRKEKSRGVLLISHDLNLVMEVCPRTLVLQKGRLCYDGDTSKLLLSHDISAEYGLVPPEIIDLWKTLRVHKNDFHTTDGFPGFDAEEIETWIKALPVEKQQQMCSVLKQYLPELKLQSVE